MKTLHTEASTVKFATAAIYGRKFFHEVDTWSRILTISSGLVNMTWEAPA
jgi:hypothetical protein